MAWQSISCPRCGREVSYLFSLESLPGQRLCAECVRECRHHQGATPAAPRPHREPTRRPRRARVA